MQLIIFTDGSLRRKLNNTLVGYGIYFPNSEYNNISGKVGVTDIHYAEIYAINYALHMIKNDINKYDKIKFFTDSHHCINKIDKWYNHYINGNSDKMHTKKGNDIKNKNILIEIFNIISINRNKFDFVHVKSHTGQSDFNSFNNKIVDKLAKYATKI